MIIIKTQNGSIYPVSDNEFLKIDSTCIASEMKCSDYQFDLGQYESEERAKEVMAEIEEYIKDKYSNALLVNSTIQRFISDDDFIDDTIEILKNAAICIMPEK